MDLETLKRKAGVWNKDKTSRKSRSTPFTYFSYTGRLLTTKPRRVALVMDHIEYMRKIGAKGNAAMRGTPMAKERASLAARTRWASLEDRRTAFRDAIGAFVNWNEGEPEPTVDYQGERITISKACGLVWSCKSILPGVDYDHLDGYTNAHPKLNTYSAAARAMLEAIKETK
jgi:hypothetical protein